MPQRRAGEVAQLGVVPLGLQFCDNHNGQHYVMLGEAAESMRIAEQYRGVDDIGAAARFGSHDLPFCAAARPRARPHASSGRPGESPDPYGSESAARRLTVHPSPPGRAGFPRPHSDGTTPPGCDGSATPRSGLGLPAEATLPLTVGAQRTDEVDLAEVRPKRFAEVELAVGGLPHQKAAEPLFAGGSDDQVRIGLALGVEVLSNVFDIECLRDFLDRRAVSRVLG